MKQEERYEAIRLNPAQAADVWERSSEASAFTRPDHLQRLVNEVEWWGAKRGSEIVAAWPFLRTVVGGEIGLPPFCYYVGPFFARSIRERNRYVQSWAGYTYALSAIVDAVVDAYPRFQFALPLGNTDLRVLQWWNHDHPNQSGFRIVPRYTARIELSRFRDEPDLLMSFGSDRRRSIRKVGLAPPRLIDDVSTERLIELDQEAIIRTGGAMTTEREIALVRMLDLVRAGGGAIIGVIPVGSTRVEAAVVLLDGPQESNLILCASSENWREKGLTVWTVWMAMLRARSIGKRWFDFNGANSPGRAADKHLYSAEEMLYFNCGFESA